MSSLLKHPVTVIVITIIALFYYLSLDKSARKAEVSSEAVSQLEGELSQIQGEVSVLEKQIESVNHPISQEKALRNELLLQRPGEYVLQVPPIEVSETPHIQQEQTTPWQEWKKILF